MLVGSPKPRRRFVPLRKWGVYVGQFLYNTHFIRYEAEQEASERRRRQQIRVTVIPVDIIPAYKKHRKAEYNECARRKDI